MLEQSGAAMADELVIKSELVMVFLVFYEDIYLGFGMLYLVLGTNTNHSSALVELFSFLKNYCVTEI